MDVLSPSWFQEVLGMEDPNPFFMDQCDIMDAFDEEVTATLGDDFQISLSPENSNSSSSTLIPRSSSTTTLCVSSSIQPPSPPYTTPIERPKKHHKPNNYNSSTTNHTTNFDHQSSSTPIILNFGNNSSQPERAQPGPVGAMNPEDEAVLDALVSQSAFGNHNEVAKGGQGMKKANARTRPPSQTYDHIIAERKRREQLSQRFVALSAIVPGLKKMDKTSVLGDAIKYLKQLQERVKTLEEQTTKQTMESVVLVRKSQISIEDEGSSDENNSNGGSSNDHLPEIEARISDKSVLIRIHCEKHKGVLVKILSEIEKMNLAILNTSVLPFGTLALDVTIIAEMEQEFNMTLKGIVSSLRSAVRGYTRT
ncbi:hypothetical protein LguiA_005973 [Lonicera macranthoides]